MFQCGTAPKIGKAEPQKHPLGVGEARRTAGAEGGVCVAPDRTEHDSSADSTVLL